jgi:hypothetical protein
LEFVVFVPEGLNLEIALFEALLLLLSILFASSSDEPLLEISHAYDNHY